MKQLSKEEWNEIQARTRRWNREHGVTPQMQARIDAAARQRPMYDQAMIQRVHMTLRMMHKEKPSMSDATANT